MDPITDPIAYPVLVLGGRDLTLKVTFGGLRRLRDQNIGEAWPSPEDIPESHRYLAGHVGACSYVLKDGALVWSGMSTADAEEIIEPRDIPRIMAALNEALVKATAAETSPVQPPGS